MATIVGESRHGFGVNITWAFDCGHQDVLFYGGRKFADVDTYVADQTECLSCASARWLATVTADNKLEQHKHVVAIEEVEMLRHRLNTINSIPLTDIVWTRADTVIPVAAEAIANWKFMGLSNVSFAEMVLVEYDEVEE